MPRNVKDVDGPSTVPGVIGRHEEDSFVHGGLAYGCVGWPSEEVIKVVYGVGYFFLQHGQSETVSHCIENFGHRVQAKGQGPGTIEA